MKVGYWLYRLRSRLLFRPCLPATRSARCRETEVHTAHLTWLGRLRYGR